MMAWELEDKHEQLFSSFVLGVHGEYFMTNIKEMFYAACRGHVQCLELSIR